MIVACIVSTVERTEIVQAAAGLRVLFPPDARRTTEALLAPSVVAVVVEPHGESASEVKALANALEQRSVPPPLLLRFDLRRHTIRQVLEYMSHVPDLRLSLRGFDDLSESVSKLLHALERTGRETIVARVVPLVRPSVSQIIACAAICGERRCTVSDLGCLCEMSTRTVEERLANAQVMGAKKLLMRVLVLHTLWRESVLGWSPKHAATAAGFPSPDALARRMHRVTGQRPRELLENRSFSEALEDVAVELLLGR